MPKVPLQNTSLWSHRKTVEEASCTVAKWPEWKRERQLSSIEWPAGNSDELQTGKAAVKKRARFSATACQSAAQDV